MAGAMRTISLTVTTMVIVIDTIDAHQSVRVLHQRLPPDPGHPLIGFVTREGIRRLDEASGGVGGHLGGVDLHRTLR